jgi:hypothetical protein
VVAVAARNSVLGGYLTGLLGPPTIAAGDVMAWNAAHSEAIHRFVPNS